MAPAITVPMKDLKNTADFTATVQKSSSPVLVTKNGREEFVAMSKEAYEALALEAARSRLYAAILEAEDDFAAGRYEELSDSQAACRARYGL